MQNFNNIPPNIFSLSAVAVGALLTDDMSPNEQNALGNWLMLISQYLCTNAALGQLQQSNNKTPGSFSEQNNNNGENTIVMLRKMIEALNREVEEIKNKL